MNELYYYIEYRVGDTTFSSNYFPVSEDTMDDRIGMLYETVEGIDRMEVKICKHNSGYDGWGEEYTDYLGD